MIEPKEPQTTDHTLMSTDDAMVWAEEFCRIFDGRMVGQEAVSYTDSHQRIDEGTMVGWFANAMQVAVNMYAQRTASEAIQLPEGWEDDQFRSESDDIIDLVEALQRDEEDARAQEEQFLLGYYEGRPEEL